MKWDSRERNVAQAGQLPVKSRVLLLTNNESTRKLCRWLEETEEVFVSGERIQEADILHLKPDLIISYNYKHIIREDVINFCEKHKISLFNLHISFLPWNRGSNPNFWSFVEDTPKGVTLHKVSPGLDEGEIVFRKELFLDARKETFTSSYWKLNEAAVKLLEENWMRIKQRDYTAVPQEAGGSSHDIKAFRKVMELCPADWEENIDGYLKKLKGRS